MTVGGIYTYRSNLIIAFLA